MEVPEAIRGHKLWTESLHSEKVPNHRRKWESRGTARREKRERKQGGRRGKGELGSP